MSAPAALRPALPGLLTAAHQLFELAGGSGVIGQHRVGLGPAAALSFLTDAAWVAMAIDDRRRWHRPLGVGAGTAVAAPVLHYTLFPWRLRFGVPVLEDAEGMRGVALAGYVTLLYAWGASGVVAVRHLPRSSRPWALVGVGLAVAFRQVASRHLVWIREEARTNPQWWNRAWRDG